MKEAVLAMAAPETLPQLFGLLAIGVQFWEQDKRVEVADVTEPNAGKRRDKTDGS